MKKNHLLFFLIVLFANMCSKNLMAQTIQLVPGQNSYNKYLGDQIIYNNNLYINYISQGLNRLSNHLAKCNGNQIIPIDDPDEGGEGYLGFPIVFSNKLYIQFNNTLSSTQLAVYDGLTISLIPNPDNTLYYVGFPIIFNGKLYLEYAITPTSFELFAFDGNSFSPVANPAGTSLLMHDLKTAPIVFNDKLYLPYGEGTSNYTNIKLGEYDGTNLLLLPDPAGGVNGYDGYPTVYNNKLYFTYGGATAFFLAEYDGTNPIKPISNPDNIGSIPLNMGLLIVFNNKLYLRYTSGPTSYLGQFDGASFTLITNPDLGVGYQGNPIIYKNKLYFKYMNISGISELAEFDGTTISPIINPVGTNVSYDNQLTVYHGYLYTAFTGSPGTFQYDGTDYTPIAPPNNGAGYNGSPIISNDTLFFGDRFNSSGDNHLAYLGHVLLPIKILSFNTLLKNNDVWLQWQTATEENTSYFNILRSNDGRNFNNIGRVSAAGNSSTIKNYTYTDANVTSLNVSKSFYRLQEVDKDGSTSYSNIQAVNLIETNLIFSISPNPTKDFINIVSSDNRTEAQVRITDISGKTLYTTKQNFVAGRQLKIQVSKFSSNILIVSIITTNEHVQFKIVNE